nr:MAG TPA: hypothetical protein [Caudoviricetes sp.]
MPMITASCMDKLVSECGDALSLGHTRAKNDAAVLGVV